MIYPNEITIIFNLVGPNREILGQTRPRVLRIPDDTTDDFESYVKNHDGVTTLVESCRASADQDVVFDGYILQSSQELRVVFSGEKVTSSKPKPVEVPKRAQKSPRAVINKMLLDNGYEPVPDEVSWEQFRDYSVNTLAGIGLNLRQIRDTVKSETGIDNSV